MIEWYKDKDIKIFFSDFPIVKMRYALPSMTILEKNAVYKFPFESKMRLSVELFDLTNNKNYEFIIRKNYCWDGATIPRFLWRLIGAKTDPSFLIPSLVHDVLCENKQYVNYDRNFSSCVFKALLLSAGVSKIKAQIMYIAVDNYQKFQGWHDIQKS